TRAACAAAGWAFLAWAALRAPNAATVFLAIIWIFLLVHALLPALRQLWLLPRRPETTPPLKTQSGAAPAAAALLVGCLILLGSENASHALSHPEPAKTPAVAESVHQDIRVDDKFAFANAKIRWRAEKGDLLPLLFEPAVLTKISYPTNA